MHVAIPPLYKIGIVAKPAILVEEAYNSVAIAA